jgi:hypothetical protein
MTLDSFVYEATLVYEEGFKFGKNNNQCYKWNITGPFGLTASGEFWLENQPAWPRVVARGMKGCVLGPQDLNGTEGGLLGSIYASKIYAPSKERVLLDMEARIRERFHEALMLRGEHVPGKSIVPITDTYEMVGINRNNSDGYRITTYYEFTSPEVALRSAMGEQLPQWQTKVIRVL